MLLLLFCILPSSGGLTPVQVFNFFFLTSFSFPAGVPGRLRPTHGQGSQEGQAGSVDQRLHGRAGMSHASIEKTRTALSQVLPIADGKMTLLMEARRIAPQEGNQFSVLINSNSTLSQFVF